MKRPLEIGKVQDGLYLLCSTCLHKSCSPTMLVESNKCRLGAQCNCFSHSCTSSVKYHSTNDPLSSCLVTKSTHNNENDAFVSVINMIPTSHLFHEVTSDLLWHYRLGHVPFVKIKGISSIPVRFHSKQPFICDICLMARQTRLPFPSKSHNTTKIFELLHVDLWGLYHVTTHENYKYFITLVDDFSRATWTYLLSCKSNALHIIKAFVNMVENQFKITVKSIRTDNGMEFTSHESTLFFQSKGILHQKSCPYTPQQNGVLEIKHIYLLETARALLFQSNIPTKYWGE